jgi:hypothetical protein
LARCTKWGCLLCKGSFKVSGCPSCFWDHLLVFSLKTFLFVTLFPIIISLSMLVYLFQLDPHAIFLKTFKLRLFGLPTCPFWCTPKLLLRLKCKFEGENNERSGDTFPNSQHFEG